ncbi:MAG: choline-sulfatase [Pseudomonadota bacterium]
MKPNILVIMADQLAPHFCGAYGNTVVKTPHLDALAARGTRFDAAYCNSPLCAPSRFSFMSGQFISRIAAYDNASEFAASTPTFAHYLRTLGYQTCLSGKMHFVGPDQKHGFEDRVTTDIYPADFDWTPNWEEPDERIDKFYHNMSAVVEAGPAIATFQTDYDDEVGYATRRWLVDWARDRASDGARPFCLVASFMHPHDPYVAKPQWWDLYEDADIPLPEVSIPYAELDPGSQRYMDGIEASKTDLTEDQIRAARRGYFANTSYFDSKIGEIVATLEEIGELDRTIIVVTSDHGDMLGERGLWYKMSMFEHSARVPLVIAGPGVAAGSVPNACSLVDLLPTFLDIAGGDTAMLGAPVDGRSLWPLACGSGDSEDIAVCEYCAEMTPAPVIMLRRGSLKYIHCDPDPPMLFDLARDPLELNNLADHPEYAERAKALAAEIASGWECEALRQDVIRTQNARRVTHKAHAQGASEHWDYNPPSDASEQYVRNHMDWAAAARRYRLDRV